MLYANAINEAQSISTMTTEIIVFRRYYHELNRFINSHFNPLRCDYTDPFY